MCFMVYLGLGSLDVVKSSVELTVCLPKKRFQAQKSSGTPTDSPTVDSLPSVAEGEPAHSSPKQVFSPPISLPESTSTDGTGLSSSSSDEDSQPVPNVERPSNSSSTSSLNRIYVCIITLQLFEHFSASRAASLRSTDSPQTGTVRTSSAAFDFDDKEDSPPPSVKRSKMSPPSSSSSKFAAPKERRPVYQHKWTENDDEDNESGDESAAESHVSPGVTAPTSSAQQRGPIYKNEGARIHRVKEAHQCLESGEHDDFKQDIEYILSTMKGNASINIKCLSFEKLLFIVFSTLSLARKCVSPEFRQFIRSEGLVSNVFKGLAEAANDQNLAICAATVIYLMSRDFISLPVDAHSLRLLSQLLRIEKLDQNEEQKKYASLVWEVFTSYIERMESVGKKIVFDLNKDQLTPSALILEALVFVLARSTDENLKTELLNLGILQYIVGKVEKIVLRLIHDKLTESETIQQLVVLERCFRILESCTLFHKKNQAFLISHRGSLLIQMCGKLMTVIHDTISNCAVGSELARSHIACLSLMARVLMNLSHENELCCTKLGQVPGFLPQCLSSYTFLAPKFAPEDKKFDLYVMMTSLCVNLVERCNSNRRKLIDTSVKVYSEDGEATEYKALDALAILFTIHEAKARNIDEDLDKDLASEVLFLIYFDFICLTFFYTQEPIDEDNNDTDEEVKDDGRLDRAKLNEMSESEMLQAVQSAMSKASAHMEDSVVASYVALLIGCLLQQNEGHVSAVRSHLQDGSLSPMIDQLQRFLDFMKIAVSL
ncbi:wings apart-like protein [Ancylostoma duodenale]|uniref:Wings apart-like protein n=1 Tax=Ancylostoma duodenale TaxID=51022 RepID=A0A0C2GFV8_9BILA|nr:wings apart-like protein [Ancylostoma duodenale]